MASTWISKGSLQGGCSELWLELHTASSPCLLPKNFHHCLSLAGPNLETQVSGKCSITEQNMEQWAWGWKPLDDNWHSGFMKLSPGLGIKTLGFVSSSAISRMVPWTCHFLSLISLFTSFKCINLSLMLHVVGFLSFKKPSLTPNT